jgi:hypothetical protein
MVVLQVPLPDAATAGLKAPCNPVCMCVCLPQVSFDFFICGSVFMDVAATSVLCNATGGQVRQFAGFRRSEVGPTDPEVSPEEVNMMITEATESLCSNVRIRLCNATHAARCWPLPLRSVTLRPIACLCPCPGLVVPVVAVLGAISAEHRHRC